MNAVFLAILVHVGFNVDLPLIPFRQASEAIDRLALLLSAVGWMVVAALVAPRLRGVRRLDGPGSHVGRGRGSLGQHAERGAAGGE